MNSRKLIWSLLAVAIALSLWLGFGHRERKAAAVPTPAATAPSPTPAVAAHTVTAQQARKAYLPQANEVLATVNGHAITLKDLAPFNFTNATAVQPMDAVTYDYLLQRAINRELINEAAQARGVGLSDGQFQQLDKVRSEREQGEPGLVTKLSVNEAQIAFDLEDQRTFMLQTSLMALQNQSPDVNESQVEQYYTAHSSEFDALPTDEPAHTQAWNAIDKQIRETLAGDTRTQYQQQLDKYMAQLKAGANISLTPMTEASANGQGMGL